MKGLHGLSIVRITGENENFYRIMGRFFGNRQITKELGMPIYNDSGRIWFVAMDGDNPIACSSIEIKKGKGSKASAVFKSSWVSPEWRGKGIYNALFEERFRAAAGSGVKIITATATEASRKTFLRHGFENIGMRGKYYLMRREIG